MNLTELRAWLDASFLDRTFFGAPVEQWLLGLLAWIAIFLLLLLVRGIVVRRVSSLAERTENEIDDYVAQALRETRTYFLVALSAWTAMRLAAVPDVVEVNLGRLAFLLLMLQAFVWGNAGIGTFSHRYRAEKLAHDAEAVTTMHAIVFLGRLLLISVLVLLTLDNFGVDVTALVAGLGITGVAVALAVQNILGDLLASLSIVLDKPFVVGDFLMVGDFLGSVEYIGLKTTRLRSLSGEQLIFSNSDLLSSRIRNFKRMAERRVVFEVGVAYQTTAEQLEAIPGMIRQIVERQTGTRFDRSHFRAYGDSSLLFETVYFVLTPDYNRFMDVQQAINLAIFERFASAGIAFAYPTRTLHVASNDTDAGGGPARGALRAQPQEHHGQDG